MQARQLVYHVKQLDPFFEDIGNICTQQHGENLLEDILKEKKQEVQSGKIKGLMLFKVNNPIGFAWVDLVTKNYGNIVLHVYQDVYVEELCKAVSQKGLLSGNLVELIQYKEIAPYRAAMTKLRFIETHRQRMGMELEADWAKEPEIPKNLTFEPITKKDIPEIAEISFEAHKVSKDQHGYPDLASVQSRIALEERVFSNIYGNVIGNASVLLRDKGKLVGFIVNVDIKCWGYDHVPWIFDISVRPDCHGKGYGKLLLQYALAVLFKEKYPAIGLSVTCSNTPAIQLYEKLGLQFIEDFYEYLDRDSFILPED